LHEESIAFTRYLLTTRGRPWPNDLGRWLQTTLPSPLWVWIPTGYLNYFMSGNYPASLLNVGGSTQIPVRAWNNSRKGTWGLSLPVKLAGTSPYDIYCVGVT
jgi:hypothetical protein